MAKEEAQPKYIKDLGTFINEITDWGKGKNKALWDYHEDHVRVRIYTNGHVYSIVAKPNYLGCQASTRKPRPGEDWTRGNDLVDGDFSEGTWLRILKDIVGYELMSISDYVLAREEGDDNLTQAENQLEVVES